MQMFHRPVNMAMQGDRVGICVTQLDAKLLERGLACDPGVVPMINGAIIQVEKIRFFKSNVLTDAKFHVTVGHSTVMGTCTFFTLPEGESPSQSGNFDQNRDYKFQDELHLADEQHPKGSQWAVLILETPVMCPLESMVIGSKLDTDIHSNACRLAFSGKFLKQIDTTDKKSIPLRIYKIKNKEGTIDRVVDEYTIIGKDLFKKETDINIFVGLKVKRSTGEEGVIESSFGKSGKFKVRFPQGNQKDVTGSLSLQFKRYLFSKEKSLKQ